MRNIYVIAALFIGALSFAGIASGNFATTSGATAGPVHSDDGALAGGATYERLASLTGTPAAEQTSSGEPASKSMRIAQMEQCPAGSGTYCPISTYCCKNEAGEYRCCRKD